MMMVPILPNKQAVPFFLRPAPSPNDGKHSGMTPTLTAALNHYTSKIYIILRDDVKVIAMLHLADHRSFFVPWRGCCEHTNEVWIKSSILCFYYKNRSIYDRIYYIKFSISFSLYYFLFIRPMVLISPFPFSRSHLSLLSHTSVSHLVYTTYFYWSPVYF